MTDPKAKQVLLGLADCIKALTRETVKLEQRVHELEGRVDRLSLRTVDSITPRKKQDAL